MATTAHGVGGWPAKPYGNLDKVAAATTVSAAAALALTFTMLAKAILARTPRLTWAVRPAGDPDVRQAFMTLNVILKAIRAELDLCVKHDTVPNDDE